LIFNIIKKGQFEAQSEENFVQLAEGLTIVVLGKDIELYIWHNHIFSPI